MALHGNDAYERKLRPLYDALDARSWKQAVKLADAALKKYKGDQLVRALKGYALFRCGRDSEALQMMHDITAEGPEVERVLMTMTYTLKAAGQPQAVVQAYVAAAEMHPRDVEILEGLFKSHVKNFDFVKQQQVAMRLSKLVPAGPDNLCSWWIACSLALQARAAQLHQDQQGNPLAAQTGGGLAPDKLLQLAETIAARQVAPSAAAAGVVAGQEGSPGLSYEALLLYLDLLQGQGKAQQAVEVVQGPLGAAVPLPADRLQLRAAALVRAGDLPAASACYLQAVQAAPDDWLSWQLYLDCMLPRSSSSSSSGGSRGGRFPVGIVGGLAEIWDREQQQQQQQQGAAVGGKEEGEALALVEDSVSQLRTKLAGSDSWRLQLDKGTLRGPHLWNCELLLRRQQLAQAAADAPAVSEEQQQELAAAVGQAFAKLAATFSCANDLRPYLASLSGAAAEQLAARVHKLAAELNAQESEENEAAAARSSSTSSEGVAAGVEPSAANGVVSSVGGDGGQVRSGNQSDEVRRLQRLVNAHQLELELGLPRFATAEEAAGHAAALLELYGRHMYLSADLDEKERGYGEELVVGAVQALMAAAALEAAAAAAPQPAAAADAVAAPPPGRTIARMLQAVLVLEGAQQHRKVSAPLRLAATALYSLLGAPKLAAAQFAALDIKSILHDSMTGHWLLPLLAGGTEADTDLTRWVDGCARLHELHQAEGGESLSLALEHGTYSKVPEFVDFKERLQHSHTRALAAVGGALLGGPRGGKAASNSEGGDVSRAGQQAALQHARQLLVAAVAGTQAAADGGEPAAKENGSAGGSAGSSSSPAGPLLHLRFNEDLSTRPCWYPPASASGSAVTDWWREAAQGRLAAGYAHCWWAQPLAAEGPSPEAAAWRQRCLTELRVRLAWALIATSSLASAADAATLLEQVQPLLPLSEAAPVPGGSSLQASACRAALAMLLTLGGAAAEGEAALQQLGQACAGAGQQAGVELAAARDLPLLPGSVTSAAAAVVADCRAVAAVCSRLQKLCAAAGREAAAAAAAETAYSAAAAGKAVAQASAELTSEVPEQRVERVMQLLESCSSGSSGGALWSFEPALDARPVMAALVNAQMTVLRNTSS